MIHGAVKQPLIFTCGTRQQVYNSLFITFSLIIEKEPKRAKTHMHMAVEWQEINGKDKLYRPIGNMGKYCYFKALTVTLVLKSEDA